MALRAAKSDENAPAATSRASSALCAGSASIPSSPPSLAASVTSRSP